MTHYPKVSICVCTYRRPDGLRRLLQSLCKLDASAVGAVEIVVVDNDRLASGRAAFDAVAPDLSWPARYFVEPRSGVGHARARCVHEATGAWVAFIDDDEWADPKWISALWRTCMESNADGAFGPVLPSFAAEPSQALVDSRVYERPRHPTGAVLRWTECASGNSMFRRALFFDVGGFDPAFAQSGSEDSDFFWRCIEHGARFVWSDEAIAHEGIPPERMSRTYLLRRAYVAGQNYARLHVRREGRGAFVRMALHGLANLLVFAPLTWGAALVQSPAKLRYEMKMKGGLGKMGAAWTPVSRDYGAGPPAPPA